MSVAAVQQHLRWQDGIFQVDVANIWKALRGSCSFNGQRKQARRDPRALRSVHHRFRRGGAASGLIVTELVINALKCVSNASEGTPWTSPYEDRRFTEAGDCGQWSWQKPGGDCECQCRPGNNIDSAGQAVGCKCRAEQQSAGVVRWPSAERTFTSRRRLPPRIRIRAFSCDPAYCAVRHSLGAILLSLLPAARLPGAHEGRATICVRSSRVRVVPEHGLGFPISLPRAVFGAVLRWLPLVRRCDLSALLDASKRSRPPPAVAHGRVSLRPGGVQGLAEFPWRRALQTSSVIQRALAFSLSRCVQEEERRLL